MTEVTPIPKKFRPPTVKKGLKRGPSAKARAKDKRFKQGWQAGAQRCAHPECVRPAVEADHQIGRAVAPDLVSDPGNRQPLCSQHNGWKEDNPDAARAAGIKGAKGGTSYELRNQDPMAKIRRQMEP